MIRLTIAISELLYFRELLDCVVHITKSQDFSGFPTKLKIHQQMFSQIKSEKNLPNFLIMLDCIHEIGPKVEHVS